ncbi:hypothetical protein HGRIS_010291 [Hohenbuehelia grisea]|uniref:DUF6533 domain-containing protein n=1 Tax=Hohenbuehelia grisea TaxID=104357 RepID=A0ABR3J478_9AGAR
MSSVDEALGFQAVNRSSIASLAFLVWDIFITLDEEVHLIWPNRWTYMKFLYFFVRYFALCVQIALLFTGSDISRHFHFSISDCNIWGNFQAASAMVISLGVDWILVLRVDALYCANRGVRFLLASLLLFETICMGLGLGLMAGGTIYDQNCTVLDVPKALIIYGVSTLIVQLILFILSAVRFIAHARSDSSRIPLLSLVVRDGAWAFFLVAAVEVGHGALFEVKNRAFSGVLYCWALTIFSFSGYRILLNLQTLAPEKSRASTQMTTDIELQFASQAQVTHLS